MRRGKQGEEGSARRGGKSAERWRKRGEEGRARRGGKIAARTRERCEERRQCNEDGIQS